MQMTILPHAHPMQVVMFDPMYDSYVSMAKRAGAVIKPVRLALPDFHVPKEVGGRDLDREG